MAAKVTASCESSAVPSKWLHEELSDVERRAIAIRAILQDDFTDGKSDEIVYTREGEIIGLFDEMARSYATLARDHDHLMAKFIRPENASSKEKRPSNDSDPDPDNGSDSSPVSGVEDPEIENFDICPFLGPKSSTGEIEEETWSWEEMTSRVTELVEKSGKKQEELARRNEEKREIIRGLRTEVNGLKAENRALQDCLVGPNVSSEVVNGGNQLRKASSLKEMGGITGPTIPTKHHGSTCGQCDDPKGLVRSAAAELCGHGIRVRCQWARSRGSTRGLAGKDNKWAWADKGWTNARTLMWLSTSQEGDKITSLWMEVSPSSRI